MHQRVKNTLIAVGVVILTLVYFTGVLDYGTHSTLYWKSVPVASAVFLMLAFIDYKFLTDMYLQKVKVAEYCFILLLIALLFCSFLSCFQILLDENLFWTVSDTYGGLLNIFLFLVLIGVVSLYRKWETDIRETERISADLDSYITHVREVFPSTVLFSSIDLIINCLKNHNGEQARHEIQRLSEHLRNQLYELKMPQLPGFDNETHAIKDTATRLIISHKYRTVRIFMYQLLFLLIPINVFAFMPMQMDAMLKVVSCITMYGVINLAYLGIRKIFRYYYLPTKRAKPLLMALTIYLLLISAPLIIIPFVESTQDSMFFSIIKSAAILVDLGMFVGGVSGILYIKEWLKSRQLFHELRFAALQEEMYFLRKQINPHFLFNVLNNADLSSYSDTETAYRIMVQLKRLLEFQFDDATRMEITVGDEVERLEAYLSLESYRTDNFQFNIEVEQAVKPLKIPSLLLMTFAENAVKYSKNSINYRFANINISADKENMITFVIENNVGENRTQNGVGGIGLTNTIRRLSIIYDDRYSLRLLPSETSYKVELKIPALC